MQVKVTEKLNENGGGAQTPRRIITHSMGEYLLVGGVARHAPDFITDIGLSAHYYLPPGGGIIRQRQDSEIAYHAKGHNTGTIGVEWLVKGEHSYSTWSKAIAGEWVDPEQYKSGIELYRHLMAVYGITVNQRHSDFDPSRKIDPGDGFPWERFLEDIS